MRIALNDQFAILTVKHRNSISGHDYLIITGDASRSVAGHFRAGKTITIYIRTRLWPAANGGSELFRLNRTSMRTSHSASRDTRRYLHCQEDWWEWISARLNTWMRYTGLNAIFQFTPIDPLRLTRGESAYRA